MHRDKKKKVLFVMGMENKLENLIQQKMNIDLENSLIIHHDGLEDLEPFGHFMRNIIVTVYKENVEEIYLVSMNDDNMKEGSILNEIYERIDSQKEIQTLDYLFKNCTPEFPARNLRDWIEGSKALSTDVQNRIKMIQNHPLMPSDIKVSEVLFQNEGDNLL